MDYERRNITLHTRVCIPAKSFKHKVWTDENLDKYLVTTPGKLIFNEILPDAFPYVNEASKENFEGMTPDKFFIEPGVDLAERVKEMPVVNGFVKKDLEKLIAQIFKRFKTTETSIFLDKLKNQGFKYSTLSGITFSLSDIPVSDAKQKIIEDTQSTVDKVNKQYKRGLITDEERHRKVVDLWLAATKDVQKAVIGEMAKTKDSNPLAMIFTSKARGNDSQLGQLSGMRGIMSKPDGEEVEIPIFASFKEGLDVQEFFLSSHGSRKGTADTALKTADAGYLTRRLVDVVQDLIIKEEDCGTIQGLEVSAFIDDKSGTVLESFEERILGRFTNQKVINPETKELIIDKGELITEQVAKKIIAAGITKLEIRSVLTCKTHNGLCQKCYGRNLATGNVVEVGEAVGIMAAQSIGEPGTQLTMRTFHTGGVAGADDITQGLPRVEELFEARIPKAKATIAEISGKVTKIQEEKGKFKIYITNDVEVREHITLYNAKLRVEKGQMVEAGQPLTEGSISPKELLAVTDPTTVQEYILREVQKVYKSQGVDVSDKHIETVVKRMISKIRIVDAGDTDFVEGTSVTLREFGERNKPYILEGKVPATGKAVLLGITKASLETDSFLSAASFQETTRILTDAAVRGKIDHLTGLKENVILGKLIPAGTGAKQYKDIEFELKKEFLSDDPAEALEETFMAETEEDIATEDVTESEEPKEDVTTEEE